MQAELYHIQINVKDQKVETPLNPKVKWGISDAVWRFTPL